MTLPRRNPAAAMRGKNPSARLHLHDDQARTKREELPAGVRVWRQVALAGALNFQAKERMRALLHLFCCWGEFARLAHSRYKTSQ